MTIRLFRKAESKVKLSAKAFSEALATMATQDIRVLRPSIVEFFLKGGFDSLPLTPQTLVDSPYKRPKDNGWEIPLDSRGRKAWKMVEASAANLGKKKSTDVDFGKKVFTIPVADLADIVEATSDNKTAESIRIWINANLGQFGITDQMFSVCIDV